MFNFGAGPGCLPPSVLEQIRQDIPNWYQGMSIMEMGHRQPPVVELFQNTEQDLRAILDIPADFAVLFMQGGARAQFAAVPLNLLNGQSAHYIINGYWSELASIEAKKYISPRQEISYTHYTDNETIQGIEFETPPTAKTWLVSDMTSNLLTKPIDFSPFGLIYASCQKNLGIAGLAVVIVRKSLLGTPHPVTPATMNYALFAETNSLYNTAPVFTWYVLGLMLKWAKTQGDIETLARLTTQKSQLIYDVIDSSDFYQNKVEKKWRSRVNVPFFLPTPELEKAFISHAQEAGLFQLTGHKLFGGMRASFFNAMPLKGAQTLADFMREFERTHG